MVQFLRCCCFLAALLGGGDGGGDDELGRSEEVITGKSSLTKLLLSAGVDERGTGRLKVGSGELVPLRSDLPPDESGEGFIDCVLLSLLFGVVDISRDSDLGNGVAGWEEEPNKDCDHLGVGSVGLEGDSVGEEKSREVDDDEWLRFEVSSAPEEVTSWRFSAVWLPLLLGFTEFDPRLSPSAVEGRVSVDLWDLRGGTRSVLMLRDFL